MNNTGSWRNHPTIFISHSSEDLILGRATRNILEDLDHHVLLLGLLQDMTEYEVFALVDKEIKARDWLLLIDSESARKSQWVQFELTQARKYGREVYRINARRYAEHHSTRYSLEAAIQPCVALFSQSIRIFPSYSYKDQATVKMVLEYLISKKYQVWNPAGEIAPGQGWTTGIESEIKDSSVVLVFLGSDVVSSQWQLQELSFASAYAKPIIPVVLDPSPILIGLKGLQYIRVDNPEDTSWQETLNGMLSSIRYQMISPYCE